jgi:hypothetical protein
VNAFGSATITSLAPGAIVTALVTASESALLGPMSTSNVEVDPKVTGPVMPRVPAAVEGATRPETVTGAVTVPALPVSTPSEAITSEPAVSVPFATTVP